MNNVVANAILDSANILVTQAINELNLTKTVLCTVLSKNEKETNVFSVTDGTYTFDAKALGEEEADYSENSRVYVQIIDGDYTKDKIILGAYKTDSPIKYSYISPLNGVVKAAEFINNEVTTYPLPEYFGNFDYLVFKLALDVTATENYSINIDLKEADTGAIVGNFKIDSVEFFGNPFNLIPELEIEKGFELKDIIIDSNKTYILECNIIKQNENDKVNFKDKDNIPAYFAYDEKKAPAKSTSFITFDNDRTFTFYWYDKDTNTLYSPNNTTGFPKSFVWQSMTTSADWNIIKETQEELVWTMTVPEDWNGIIRYRVRILQEKINENVTLFHYSTIVKWPLEYQAEEELIELTAAADTLSFTLEPGDTGVYNYYGINNRFFDISGSNKKTLWVTRKDTGVWPADEIAYVEWRIPKKMCSIEEATNNRDNYYRIIEDNNYYIYRDEKEFRDNFSYRLKSYHDPIRNFNKIYCEVGIKDSQGDIAEILQGNINFVLGTQGNSGLQYNLNTQFTKRYIWDTKVGITDDIPYFIIGKYNSQLDFKVLFENAQGENFEKQTFNWSIYKGKFKVNEGNTPYFDITPKNNYLDPKHKEAFLSILGDNPIISNIIEPLVIKVETKIEEDVSDQKRILSTLYPIPIVSDNITNITGPSQVVYGVDNQNPSYDTETPYSLVGVDEEIFWSIEGTTDFTLDENNRLKIPYIYTGENGVYSVIARNVAGEVLAILPLIISSNLYGSPSLNQWSGELLVDEAGNQIMAGSIAAGVKNSDNTFTGIFMGKVDITNPDNLPLPIGLYGYNQGVRRFSFDKDGEAYIAAKGLEINSQFRIEEGDNKGGIIQCYSLEPELDENGHEKKDENDNLIYQKNERVRIGYVRTEGEGLIKKDIYGIDIYEGAFRMYSTDSTIIQNIKDDKAKKELASIYFEKNNMYLNGEFVRIGQIKTYQKEQLQPDNTMLIGKTRATDTFCIGNENNLPAFIFLSGKGKDNSFKGNVLVNEIKFDRKNSEDIGKFYYGYDNYRIILGQGTLQTGDSIDPQPSAALSFYQEGNRDSNGFIISSLSNQRIPNGTLLSLVSGRVSSSGELDDYARINLTSRHNNGLSEIYIDAQKILFVVYNEYGSQPEVISIQEIYNAIK